MFRRAQARTNKNKQGMADDTAEVDCLRAVRMAIIDGRLAVALNYRIMFIPSPCRVTVAR
jgi:hypothetical protein